MFFNSNFLVYEGLKCYMIHLYLKITPVRGSITRIVQPDKAIQFNSFRQVQTSEIILFLSPLTMLKMLFQISDNMQYIYSY